jgi:hypothetical protein
MVEQPERKFLGLSPTQGGQTHYYMVEPGRNLYYVPALFSAPHMSNFRTKKRLVFICNLLIGHAEHPHDFLF